MRRGSRIAVKQLFDNPVMVGTITILVVMVAVYLSYIAENGLPFVPTYNVNVDVANASELVKNADVRVGGARVGQVLTITPEPASKSWPHPYARLGLALQKSLAPLPPNTRYRVRLASVLGGKYLELIPGNSRAPGLPDGGTFTLNRNPKLNHNLPFVDLDTAFATFGPKTQKGLRGAIGELGNTLAGRGPQFNDSISSLHELMPGLETLLGVLRDPSTRLSGFISGLAATTGALAPVAPTIDSLLHNTATTFAALDRPSLGQTIDQLPETESLATTVLSNSRPVLADAATLVQALKPGARLLPAAAIDLDRILVSATPVFKDALPLAPEPEKALAAVQALAHDPASTQVFKVLGSTDLASLGASAFVGLGAILRAVAPSQFACNITALWVRNFASGLSEGDSQGAWLRFAPLLDFNGGTASQTFQQSSPSPDLHINYYPTEDSSQCQAGNEVYSGAQRIGSPPRTSTVVDDTAPPPGVLEEGKKAGLVP
jgi:phospholipid/cholesterol/gamma-HCH transport system substrate-binding protein